jgi:hypothetical protein
VSKVYHPYEPEQILRMPISLWERLAPDHLAYCSKRVDCVSRRTLVDNMSSESFASFTAIPAAILSLSLWAAYRDY